ncbi:MAG TPA: hypothetical protein VJG90_03435 [Candidatus Nanoarchaeia archaeon]|nr:hypothetical protein [Candidatus Nanoarchaeia archaeon]
MEEGTLETDIDQLLNLLKKEDKLPLEEVASRLNVSMEVVQTWIDFLVEEGIIGIEYKFTKPFVFMIRDKKAEPLEEEDENWEKAKKTFYMSSLEKNVPEDQISTGWKQKATRILEGKKEFFFTEAKRRRAKNPEALWESYKEKVLSV